MGKSVAPSHAVMLRFRSCSRHAEEILHFCRVHTAFYRCCGVIDPSLYAVGLRSAPITCERQNSLTRWTGIIKLHEAATSMRSPEPVPGQADEHSRISCDCCD